MLKAICICWLALVGNVLGSDAESDSVPQSENPQSPDEISQRIGNQADVLSSFVGSDVKMMAEAAQGLTGMVPGMGGILGAAAGLGSTGFKLPSMMPVPVHGHGMPVPMGKPIMFKPHAPIVAGAKLLKIAAPVKKKVAIKAKGLLAAQAAMAVPKLKLLPLAKPKVTKLKPIVHVVYKPVPVYHKVPVPKKILIPKPFPVPKLIPVPKFIPVPFKVPVIKIIPKIVPIPKAVHIPKIVPVKKFIPVPIPVPVLKFHKVPVLKPVPFLKPIPIPVPKPFPKFIPVPVKKIIKVPKPYYVPIKVPHITKSYIKTPMVVPVPAVKPGFAMGGFGGGHGMKSPMMGVGGLGGAESMLGALTGAGSMLGGMGGVGSMLGAMGGAQSILGGGGLGAESMIKDSLEMLSGQTGGGRLQHFGTGATAFGGVGGDKMPQSDMLEAMAGGFEGEMSEGDMEALLASMPNK